MKAKSRNPSTNRPQTAKGAFGGTNSNQKINLSPGIPTAFVPTGQVELFDFLTVLSMAAAIFKAIELQSRMNRV